MTDFTSMTMKQINDAIHGAEANIRRKNASATVQATNRALIESLMAEVDRRNLVERAKAERTERDRAGRIARRGSPEDFAVNAFRSMGDEGENLLAYAARAALAKIESRTVETARFTARLAKDPVGAMEWSKDLFTAVAEASVAEEFLNLLRVGLSHSEILRVTTSKALRRASGLAQSSSATSNLMEDCTRQAFASMAERLEGNH